MPSPVLEKAAKAIHACNDPQMKLWEDCKPARWEQARAALEAALEPDPRVVEAGASAVAELLSQPLNRPWLNNGTM